MMETHEREGKGLEKTKKRRRKINEKKKKKEI